MNDNAYDTSSTLTGSPTEPTLPTNSDHVSPTLIIGIALLVLVIAAALLFLLMSHFAIVYPPNV